ncbi:MAG: PIF1 family DEAD/DEAH box helicase [Candidatus Omnitrophota bacterium]|nr:PIF1 family DEAD/DEAH box helicase [Candidatus Omnitrophota bacterium]
MTRSQQAGLTEMLDGSDNVFLTGGPGTGKSFLIAEYLTRSREEIPVVASTGAAAILIGGRTFHSFFGLGIMQGGPEFVVQKALKNKRLKRRIAETKTLVIDEVSMLSSESLDCAEKIARAARKSKLPWGGIRIIAVGDFAQLPPISRGREREWCFLSEAWRQAKFKKVILIEVKRTTDVAFLQILGDVRLGKTTERVEAFLQERLITDEELESDVPHVFPRRAETSAFNRARLSEIKHPMRCYPTEYGGRDIYVTRLKRDAPVPEILELKKSALVMMRMNDPKQRYVNGTVGTIEELFEDALCIRVGKKVIDVEPFTFTVLDDEGVEAAFATNFPVTLAYASTIHKMQGTTLDRMHVSLRSLWEPGQAYVALSRARSGKGITLMGWDPSSIRADAVVQQFYEQI